MGNKLTLSTLGHTWIFDLDGTVVKHNGYKIDGYDTLLPGAKEFFCSIPESDEIVFLTSRKIEYKDSTEVFLREQGIRYKTVIYDMPYGERILVNDRKPSGLQMSFAINTDRDCFMDHNIVLDKDL